MRLEFRIFACALALGAAACGDHNDPEEEPGVVVDTRPPAERVADVQLVPPATPYVPGRAAPVQVRAVDARGTAVAGAELEFFVREGAFSPWQAATDASGIATATWTPYRPGPTELGIQVVGGTVSKDLPVTVMAAAAEFTVKEVSLAGVGCTAELELKTDPLPDRNLFLGYSIDRPEVLRHVALNIRTGSSSWRYMGLFAQQPGSAIVVGHYPAGNAYATFNVGNALPRVELSTAETRPAAPGDTSSVQHTVYGACGNRLNGLYSVLEESLSQDTAYVRGHTLDPDVVEIIQERSSYGIGLSVRFIGRKPGQARVVATYRGAADTAVVTISPPAN
jgi:hypothetical protein